MKLVPLNIQNQSKLFKFFLFFFVSLYIIDIILTFIGVHLYNANEQNFFLHNIVQHYFILFIIIKIL